jgi:6-phosphogluconolactonase
MIRPQQELVYLVDQSAMPEVAAVSNPSMTTAPQHALVLVADTKKDIPSRLLPLIVQHSQKAIQKRGIFTIALSGGSLPSLLSSLEEMFTHLSVDPHWSKWHILLADERCVPLAHEDSNLAAIQKNLLDSIPIPDSQIHGIDESLLEAPTSVQAKAYEAKLRTVLAKAGGMLDLAVLGFGPDGHCCSLFPNHALLTERILWVAGIDSSPKPPPKRITLTLGILNEWTRNVIFCGAGASKQPILQQVFERAEVRQGPDCHVRIATNPAPFPCAMVTPQDHLAWVVDAEAMPRGLLAAASPSPSPKKSSL